LPKILEISTNISILKKESKEEERKEGRRKERRKRGRKRARKEGLPYMKAFFSCRKTHIMLYVILRLPSHVRKIDIMLYVIFL
jgi:hypothetical protein